RMDRLRAREEAPARGLRGMQPMLFRLLIRAAPILVAGCGSPDAPGNVGREPTSQGEIAFEIPCSGACAFSPDGSWLYTCDGRSLRRIELGSGRTDASWRLEAERAGELLALSADGRWLAVDTDEGRGVELLRSADGARVKSWRHDERRTRALAFS